MLDIDIEDDGFVTAHVTPPIETRIKAPKIGTFEAERFVERESQTPRIPYEEMAPHQETDAQRIRRQYEAVMARDPGDPYTILSVLGFVGCQAQPIRIVATCAKPWRPS